jgi:hypothetical protein
MTRKTTFYEAVNRKYPFLFPILSQTENQDRLFLPIPPPLKRNTCPKIFIPFIVQLEFKQMRV